MCTSWFYDAEHGTVGKMRDDLTLDGWLSDLVGKLLLGSGIGGRGRSSLVLGVDNGINLLDGGGVLLLLLLQEDGGDVGDSVVLTIVVVHGSVTVGAVVVVNDRG